MKVFIQQPYFLPWLGFLSKVYYADIYFILDEAPFRRNHLNRTRILSNGKPIWLTIPLGASQGTPICDIIVPKETKYLYKFEKTIRHSYRQSKFFNQEFSFVKELLDTINENSNNTLSNLNIKLLVKIFKYFDLEHKKILLESNYSLPQDKNMKTIKIMSSLESNILVCGDGKSTKVHDLKLFSKNNIKIKYIPFYSNHPKYEQVGLKKCQRLFLPGVSFIDALLNVGRDRVIELIKLE